MEDIVSKELALLAKEKGFNEPCESIFEFGSDEPRKLLYYENGGEITNSEMGEYPNEYQVTAPTRYHLQKWLRNKPTPIIVTPTTDFVAWQVEIMNPDKDLVTLDKNKLGRWFDSFEEALDHGLEYGLTSYL